MDPKVRDLLEACDLALELIDRTLPFGPCVKVDQKNCGRCALVRAMSAFDGDEDEIGKGDPDEKKRGGAID